MGEGSGGYVKSNALKGKRFDSLDDLAPDLRRHWNKTVAQLRIHGTTRRQVIRHFLEVEKPALKPVAVERFSLFDVGTRTVHDDSHVAVRAAYYSVPHTLVGRDVRVDWDDDLVRVYSDGTAIAVQTCKQAGQWSTRSEPRPGPQAGASGRVEAAQLARMEKIGPRALAWAKEAVKERDVRAYRLLQGVIRLTRAHPRGRVERACGTALEMRAFRYNSLKRLADEAAARAHRPQLRQCHEVLRDLAEYRSVMAGTSQPLALRQTHATAARRQAPTTCDTWENDT